MTFHGKLQFENGGALLERDNFAFCKVINKFWWWDVENVDIWNFTSNLFVLQLVELRHDELCDKSKNSIRFEFSKVIQLSCPVLPLTFVANVKRGENKAEWYFCLSFFVSLPFNQ